MRPATPRDRAALKSSPKVQLERFSGAGRQLKLRRRGAAPDDDRRLALQLFQQAQTVSHAVLSAQREIERDAIERTFLQLGRCFIQRARNDRDEAGGAADPGYQATLQAFVLDDEEPRRLVAAVAGAGGRAAALLDVIGARHISPRI